MTRCDHCKLEVLDFPLDPNSPLDRDVARLHDWQPKRWNNRWFFACPACAQVAA